MACLTANVHCLNWFYFNKKTNRYTSQVFFVYFSSKYLSFSHCLQSQPISLFILLLWLKLWSPMQVVISGKCLGNLCIIQSWEMLFFSLSLTLVTVQIKVKPAVAAVMLWCKWNGILNASRCCRSNITALHIVAPHKFICFNKTVGTTHLSLFSFSALYN